MELKPLIVHPLETRVFHPGDDLVQFIISHVPTQLVREGLIVAVTSKIVSVAEGRLVPAGAIDKRELVERESDHYLGEIGYGVHLTIKHGLLIASAGIDESNSETGSYILYPTDPYASARALRAPLSHHWGLKRLGVLITDSKTTPLRSGTTGVCLSYAGFRAINNMIGTPDLFGRELRMTRVNAADGLAAAAVLTMGEGRERRPLALIENAEVEFTSEIDPTEIQIPLEEDLYFPMLRGLVKPRP